MHYNFAFLVGCLYFDILLNNTFDHSNDGFRILDVQFQITEMCQNIKWIQKLYFMYEQIILTKKMPECLSKEAFQLCLVCQIKMRICNDLMYSAKWTFNPHFPAEIIWLCLKHLPEIIIEFIVLVLWKIVLGRMKLWMNSLIQQCQGIDMMWYIKWTVKRKTISECSVNRLIASRITCFDRNASRDLSSFSYLDWADRSTNCAAESNRLTIPWSLVDGLIVILLYSRQLS